MTVTQTLLIRQSFLIGVKPVIAPQILFSTYCRLWQEWTATDFEATELADQTCCSVFFFIFLLVVMYGRLSLNYRIASSQMYSLVFVLKFLLSRSSTCRRLSVQLIIENIAFNSTPTLFGN